MLRLYKEVEGSGVPPRPPGGTIGGRKSELFTAPGRCWCRGLLQLFFPPRSPPLSPFRFAARVLREEAAGDHFIVPRTPFRMASNAIHIRPSSKAGLCSIYSGLRFIGKKSRVKDVPIYFDLHGWFDLRA
jgi:hypothetical protein